MMNQTDRRSADTTAIDSHNDLEAAWLQLDESPGIQALGLLADKAGASVKSRNDTDKGKQFFLKLEDLSKRLNKNRVESFPGLTRQMPHTALFFAQGPEKRAVLTQYLTKNLRYFTSEAFKDHLAERVALLEQTMRHLEKHSDLKTQLEQGKTFHIRSRLMTDVVLPDDTTRRLLKTDSINIYADLEKELNAIKQLMDHFNPQNLLEEISNHIQARIEKIGGIRISPYMHNISLQDIFYLYTQINSTRKSPQINARMDAVKSACEKLPSEEEDFKALLYASGLPVSGKNYKKSRQIFKELRKIQIAFEHDLLREIPQINFELLLNADVRLPDQIKAILDQIRKLKAFLDLNPTPLRQQFLELRESGIGTLSARLQEQLSPDNIDSFLREYAQYKNAVDSIAMRTADIERQIKDIDNYLKLIAQFHHAGLMDAETCERQTKTYRNILRDLENCVLGSTEMNLDRLEAWEKASDHAYRYYLDGWEKQLIAAKKIFDEKQKLFKDPLHRCRQALENLESRAQTGELRSVDFYNIITCAENQKIFKENAELAQRFRKNHLGHLDKTARTLAQLSRDKFAAISREDFLSGKYTAKDNPQSSIVACIKFFNHLSAYVAADILSHDDVASRTLAMESWINILRLALNKYHSYDVSMAIFAGLANTAVYRLKATKQGLSESSKKYLDAIKELFATRKNSEQYRQHLLHNQGVIVPFLGQWLTDMTFAIDSMPTFTLADAVSKANLVANASSGALKTLLQFEILQQRIQASAALPDTDSTLAARLTGAAYDTGADKTLYSRSLSLEPRDQENPAADIFSQVDAALITIPDKEIPAENADSNLSLRNAAREKMIVHAQAFITMHQDTIANLALPDIDTAAMTPEFRHLPVYFSALSNIYQHEYLHSQLKAILDNLAFYRQADDTAVNALLETLNPWDAALARQTQAKAKLTQAVEAINTQLEDFIDKNRVFLQELTNDTALFTKDSLSDSQLKRLLQHKVKAKQIHAEFLRYFTALPEDVEIFPVKPFKIDLFKTVEDQHEAFSKTIKIIDEYDEALEKYETQIAARFSGLKNLLDRENPSASVLNELQEKFLGSNVLLLELNKASCERINATISERAFLGFLNRLTQEQKALLKKLPDHLKANQGRLTRLKQALEKAQNRLNETADALLMQFSDTEIRDFLAEEHKQPALVQRILDRRQDLLYTIRTLRKQFEEQQQMHRELEQQQEQQKLWLEQHYTSRERLTTTAQSLQKIRDAEKAFQAMKLSLDFETTTTVNTTDIKTYLLRAICLQKKLHALIYSLPEGNMRELQNKFSLNMRQCHRIMDIRTEAAHLQARLDNYIASFRTHLANQETTPSKEPAETQRKSRAGSIVKPDFFSSQPQDAFTIHYLNPGMSTEHGRNSHKQSEPTKPRKYFLSNGLSYIKCDQTLIYPAGVDKTLHHYENQKDLIERMIMDHLKPQQDPRFNRYEVKGDKKLVKKACIMLLALGLTPVVKKRHGGWEVYQPSATELIQIADKRRQFKDNRPSDSHRPSRHFIASLKRRKIPT